MALKITITGRVHNVGYRLFLLEEADSLFIPYFDARNVKINGKEALIVLVDGEEEQIEEFIKLVKSVKPENAVVEKIEVEEYAGRVRDIDRFRNLFNTAQLSKIVQVGLRMLEKQDKMLEKQDETIKVIREESEKTRQTVKEESGEIRKELGEKMGEVSSKLDKTNELLEKRFERLEEEIERIKKALMRAGIEV